MLVTTTTASQRNDLITSSLASPTICLNIPPKRNNKRIKKAATTTSSSQVVPVHGVRFTTTTGELLGTIHFDGYARIWAAKGMVPLMGTCKLGGEDMPLLQLAFAKRDCEMLVAGSDGHAYIIDVDSLKVKDVLMGHQSYCNGICSMGEFGTIATSSDDCTVRIWDPRIHSPSQAHEIRLEYEATSVCAVPHSETYICSGSLDGGVRVHDVRKTQGGAIVQAIGHSEVVSGLCPHPDGKHVLSYGLDGKLVLWDIQPFCSTDRAVVRFQHSPPPARSVMASDQSLLRCTFNSNGTLISCGSSSTSQFAVACYDRLGQPKFALPGHTGTVVETAFHPFENVIASCGLDGRILVGEMPSDSLNE